MKNSMLKISVLYNGKDTFQLIPTSKDCPYSEATFNPQAKSLLIISPMSFETFQMLPKINDDGNMTASKVHESHYKHERVRTQKHFDWVIAKRDEIQKFVDMVTGEINNLEDYFKVDPPKANEENKIKKLEVVKDGK